MLRFLINNNIKWQYYFREICEMSAYIVKLDINKLIEKIKPFTKPNHHGQKENHTTRFWSNIPSQSCNVGRDMKMKIAFHIRPHNQMPNVCSSSHVTETFYDICPVTYRWDQISRLTSPQIRPIKIQINIFFKCIRY